MTRLPSYLLLGWALMSISSCTTEDQEILLEVSALAWADDSPEVGATVVLEEQRLSNGVLNGFYTAVDEGPTDANGNITLRTVRSNVLSIRVRLMQDQCFEELVELNPEDLLSNGTPNALDIEVMPKATVEATLVNQLPECLGTNNNMIYRWIPREVNGAASDVRWTCGTDWQALGAGETTEDLCFITGNTWLLHHRQWTCPGVDSTVIDSVWCPKGGLVELMLD